MKKKQRTSKKHERMTLPELRAATKQFDREMVADEFRALTPDERGRWERARRKPGRPRRGAGVRVISVSVERRLLARSDALAKNLKLTRASLVERGLKAVLAAEGRL